MADAVKQLLTQPIQLADTLCKLADTVQTSKSECLDLKNRAESLVSLLRHAARTDLLERPTRRIANKAAQSLDSALSLVLRCRSHNNFLLRLFSPIPSSAFESARTHLDHSVGDVRWLLRISTEEDLDLLSLPPIASNEPTLPMVWIVIARLLRGAAEKKAYAAELLLSYARDNDHYARLIVEEDGVPPILRLFKEGTEKGQECAAAAIAALARDRESVEAIVKLDVCSAFAKALKEAPMKVQAMVAETMVDFVEKWPQCRELFAQPQSNIVLLLVGHLSFETIPEHHKYTVPSRANPMHSIAAVVQNTMAEAMMPGAASTTRPRELEEPKTKAKMKAMAAKALWKLARGNSSVCKAIAESRALLCFAVLLEKGPEEVRYYSGMAVHEIAKAAEREPELRRSAFKPTSPAVKAIVDQLIRIVEEGRDSKLLVPSVVALGCLSTTFRATETRVIGPLVRLLEDRETELMREAVVALIKFTKQENYLHKQHSEALIAAGGVMSLVQLVHFGEHIVQLQAVALLCLVAMSVPDNDVLARSEVLNVLDAASQKGYIVQDEKVEDLLPVAKEKLAIYQSKDAHSKRQEYRGYSSGIFV